MLQQNIVNSLLWFPLNPIYKYLSENSCSRRSTKMRLKNDILIISPLMVFPIQISNIQNGRYKDYWIGVHFEIYIKRGLSSTVHIAQWCRNI